MKHTRIFYAIVVLFALILDELWRMGRMREWTWEWAVAIAAMAVLIIGGYDAGANN